MTDKFRTGKGRGGLGAAKWGNEAEKGSAFAAAAGGILQRTSKGGAQPCLQSLHSVSHKLCVTQQTHIRVSLFAA
jgi:hypothetical protein